MQAAAHNPEFAKKAGISQDVAREFVEADKKKKINEEGEGSTNSTTSGVDMNPESFGGCKAFKVSRQAYDKMTKPKSKKARFKSHVDEEMEPHIRDYARKNPSATILLKHPDRGSYYVLKNGSDKRFGGYFH